MRASTMAGKTTIPTIVRVVSEQQAAEMTVIENLQRRDLNCIDLARAYIMLSQDFGMTQEQIGQRVGIAREIGVELHAAGEAAARRCRCT